MSKVGAEEAAERFDFDVERRGHEEDLSVFRNVLLNLVQALLEAVAHDQVALIYDQMYEALHRQRTIVDVDALPSGRRNDDIWIVRQLMWLTVPSRIRLASSRLIEAMNLRG